MHLESSSKPISFQLCDDAKLPIPNADSNKCFYDLNIDISSIVRLSQVGQFPISTYNNTGAALLLFSKEVYDLLDDLAELQQMEDKEVRIELVQTIIRVTTFSRCIYSLGNSSTCKHEAYHWNRRRLC